MPNLYLAKGTLMNPLFERSALVFSQQGIHQLQQSHVLVAGVGGVGGFVIEALARAGVGQLTIIDHDVVSESNLNRQIIALRSTVGLSKAEVMANRIKRSKACYQAILIL